MAQHFKVEELLSPEELEELGKWIRQVNGTRKVDEVHEWIQARGYTLGRTAVHNWMQRFREQLMAERFGRSSELARAIKAAVEGGSFDDIAAAANQQLVNVVFEQSARLQEDGDLDAEQVLLMTQSLKNLVGTKAQHTKMLAEKFDAKRKELSAKREITQADLDAVRKAVFG